MSKTVISQAAAPWVAPATPTDTGGTLPKAATARTAIVLPIHPLPPTAAAVHRQQRRCRSPGSHSMMKTRTTRQAVTLGGGKCRRRRRRRRRHRRLGRFQEAAAQHHGGGSQQTTSATLLRDTHPTTPSQRSLARHEHAALDAPLEPRTGGTGYETGSGALMAASSGSSSIHNATVRDGHRRVSTSTATTDSAASKRLVSPVRRPPTGRPPPRESRGRPRVLCATQSPPKARPSALPTVREPLPPSLSAAQRGAPTRREGRRPRRGRHTRAGQPPVPPPPARHKGWVRHHRHLSSSRRRHGRACRGGRQLIAADCAAQYGSRTRRGWPCLAPPTPPALSASASTPPPATDDDSAAADVIAVDGPSGAAPATSGSIRATVASTGRAPAPA